MRSKSTHSLPAVVAIVALGVIVAPVMSAHAMAAGIGVIDVQVRSYGGALMPVAVDVELVNIETAEVVATSTTDDQGNASFASLAHGLYQLRATAAGFIDTTSPLVPVVESTPETAVAMEMQGEQCSCDPNAPDYSADCECDEGSNAGVIAGAAAGFAFLGLGGGAAVAALIGTIAVVAGVTYGAVKANEQESDTTG